MRQIAILVSLIAVTGLAACETVKGAGRDMQTAGAAITGEAQRAQSGM